MIMTRTGWQRWISLAAAYALAIQTIFVAVAQGAQALPASSLEILCDTSGSHHPDDGDAPHEAHSTCCSLACTMFGAALVPSEAGAMPVVAHDSVAAPLATHEAGPTRPGWNPGNPRAPPSAA